MYPNPPTTPPETAPSQIPGDYLDQISPSSQKKQLLKPGPRLFILIGAALVLIVIALSITVNLISNSQHQPLERLSARLTATESIVVGAQENLKSSQLRSLNSTLRLYLTNVNRDIGEVLAGAKVDTSDLSENVVAQESTEEMASRLEDARLNAVYDRTYSREMAYQLATTLALLQEIYDGNYSAEIKDFAKEVYENLQPTHEASDTYNAS
jgi:hypothetical protein